MYIIIFIIYKKKQLIEEISNEINSDIDLILKTYNEEKKNEDLAVQGKFKVLSMLMIVFTLICFASTAFGADLNKVFVTNYAELKSALSGE